MTVLMFNVKGTPVQQGSMHGFIVGKRSTVGGKTVVENPRSVVTAVKGKQLKTWRALVRAEAVASLGDQPELDEPVYVHLTFYMERPKSRKNDTVHSTRPDIDKLARSVLDALTTTKTEKGVLKDDSRVYSLTVLKLYAQDFDTVGVNIVMGTL